MLGYSFCYGCVTQRGLCFDRQAMIAARISRPGLRENVLDYLAIKHIHVTCVVLSGAGFALRGLWMLTDSALLRQRLTRVIPHLVDTALLGSALWLAIISNQYPFKDAWLSAKLCGLLLYIVLGAFALRRGKTKGQRVLAFTVALAVFGWIVSVALSRQPQGFLLPLIQ